MKNALLIEILEIRSDHKTLKTFGLTMAIIFALIFGFVYWRHNALWWGFLVAASAFVALGAFRPVWLLPIQKVWMALALCMGWVMTRILLGIMFFLVFSLIRFIAKLKKHEFLDASIDPRRESYWKDHELSVQNKTRYENQY